MNIELAVLDDGNVMLVSDAPLPDIVKRVEYYREQKLFQLVFHNPEQEDQLMHYEISNDMSPSIEKTPNIMIYSLYPNHEPLGYKVPLVRIGEIH